MHHTAGPGKHLTPLEFHNILTASLTCVNTTDSSASSNIRYDQTKNSCSNDENNQNHDDDTLHRKQLVLLDVRNYYETRIGRFQLPNAPGVVLPTVIDPQTRQV